jgi:hypothetical protein
MEHSKQILDSNVPHACLASRHAFGRRMLIPCVERAIHIERPLRCLVRAYVDLEPTLIVHPFDITELGKYRGGVGFRWEVEGTACTLFPPKGLSDLRAAEDYLKGWAKEFVANELKNRQAIGCEGGI